MNHLSSSTTTSVAPRANLPTPYSLCSTPSSSSSRWLSSPASPAASMPTTTSDQVCLLHIATNPHDLTTCPDKPSPTVLTMMVTNAVLGGVADTVAQSITAIRERALRKAAGAPLSPAQDPVAVEIHELDRKNPFNDRELIPDSKLLPPPFDFERLTRFMAYGFCMAPLQFRWFKFLSQTFPITKTAAFVPAMKRVVFDQLIFAPFGLGVFFTAMTVAEGGGRRAVESKLRDMYVPTLKANFVLWPAVQVINFRLMPVQFQLVSSANRYVDMLWRYLNTNVVFTAICFDCRYCMDCIPFPHQCCGGRSAGQGRSELSTDPVGVRNVGGSVDYGLAG